MSDATRPPAGSAGITVDTDPSRLDLDVIHGFLSTCYWARGIPRDTVARSIDHSLCFGAYSGDRQIGFARVVTDYATFAWIADVFVTEGQRGTGVSRALMDAIVAHPRLQGLRRWMLATRDAHGLYAKYGFKLLAAPERFMEVHDPEVYQRGQDTARR